MEQLAFRNLIGVAYTEDEAKEFAEEYEYAGDPDEEGNPTTRPGKISDYFPNPYPNEEAAKFANSGESFVNVHLYHACVHVCLMTNLAYCIGGFYAHLGFKHILQEFVLCKIN